MRNICILLFTITLLSSFATSFAQTPGGINFQGVARNQYSTGLVSQLITLKFNVRKNAVNGAIIYSEVRETTTDSLGIFQVIIGSAGAISQTSNIKMVTWSDTAKKFLQVEMDIHDPNIPGFLNMGTTQLLSVPFSFYSDISDSSRIAAKADSSKISNGSGTHFFSATIPKNNFQSMPDDPGYAFNHAVKFPLLIYTEGSSYDSTTSVFTAPENGLYYFEALCHGALEKYGSRIDDLLYGYSYYIIGIFKNNTLLKIVYDDDFGIVNSSIRVKLSKGDLVSLRASAHYRNYSNTELGWNDDDSEELDNGTTQFLIDPTVFANFSGYKIK